MIPRIHTPEKIWIILTNPLNEKYPESYLVLSMINWAELYKSKNTPAAVPSFFFLIKKIKEVITAVTIMHRKHTKNDEKR